MPSPYKIKPYPLSRLNEGTQLIRIRCNYCKRTVNYFPKDLIQVLGDVDIDSLSHRMRCENGDHGRLHVEIVLPQGREAVGLRIRRLVAIQIRHVPVWRDD